LHLAGDEASWWEDLQINAFEIVRALWEQSRAATDISISDGK
jgi:hypothetical protein